MRVEKYFHHHRPHGPSTFHPSNGSGHFITPCSHVLLLPYQERCSFIKKTPGCHDAVHYFDSLNFIFCTIGLSGEFVYVGGIIVVIILCLYLFTILAMTADKFFCPTLAVISKLLRMSENLAGVTLLAFGNGSPDIFASLSNINGDTELVYCELMGAAVFVTGFIAGVVILTRPFKVVARNYVRDVIFFLIAAIFISNAIHDQGYSIAEGVATVMIYICYLCVVVFDHFQMKKKAQRIRKLSQVSSETVAQSTVADIIKRAEDLEEVTQIRIHSRHGSSVILNEDILKVFQREFRCVDPNQGLFKTFFQAVQCVDRKDWKESGWIRRTLIILKAPVLFVLLVFIPIVDYSESRHGWSKLLNMVNINTLPQLILFITGSLNLMLFDYIPLSLIVFLTSLVTSFVVYRTSRNDCPPKYHEVFAVGNFVGCVSVIYVVAKEVVSVMKTLGIISDRSDSFVGLLFLALGNSIGDLFSNITLARQGYQNMAFAACFGGPMFNSLLGVGLTFILKALKSSDNLAHTREGALGPNCIIFLVLILFFPLLSLAFTSFEARRSTGVYMIMLYSIFILLAALGEFEVMHPYGTDHEKT